MIPWTQKPTRGTGVPRPATGETPVRKVRLDDATWDEVGEIAEQQGRTRTDVVKDALARYFAWHRRQQRKKSDP